MHLTLINPPFTFFRKSDIFLSQCLGILYIASYGQLKGHQVTIIDALGEGRNKVEFMSDGGLKVGLKNEEIISRIPRCTNLIGISVPFSHLAYISHKLIEDIKDAYSSVPIVMGGVYPSTQPQLALSSEADYLVLGEGEVPTVELLDYLSNGQKKSLPEGVVPKAVPEILGSVSPYRMEHLDALPPPQRKSLCFEEYIKLSQRNDRGWRTASIITSRGCPFDCEFCSVHPVCGYGWRPFSAERVLEEIDELIEEYRVNNLEIEDDNFTLKRDRAMEILEGIIERNRGGKNIYWGAQNGLRIDTLDETLIRQISRSNCRYICLGLEHGDEEVLKSMNKKLSLSKTLEVARLTSEFEIPCTVFVIYGYPGETRERFEKALSYYMELKRIAPKIKFSCFIAQPYPGTKLFERAIHERWLPTGLFSTVETMRRFSTSEAVWIETPDFDKNEILRRRKILHRSLFSRSRYYRHRVAGLLPNNIVSSLFYIHKVGKRYKDILSMKKKNRKAQCVT